LEPISVTLSRCYFSVFLIAGVLPLRVLTAPPSAQPWHPAQESGFTLEGNVTQKSEGKLTVSTEENIVFHVRYDEKTDIRLKDGTQGSDKDLKVGVKVRVEGDLSESGEILAREIKVL
jgi:hypothetical protein